MTKIFFSEKQERIWRAKKFLCQLFQIPITNIRFLTNKHYYDDSDYYTLRLDFEGCPPGRLELELLQMLTQRYGQKLKVCRSFPNCYLITEIDLFELEHYIEEIQFAA